MSPFTTAPEVYKKNAINENFAMTSVFICDLIFDPALEFRITKFQFRQPHYMTSYALLTEVLTHTHTHTTHTHGRTFKSTRHEEEICQIGTGPCQNQRTNFFL